ncbi:uncharacterized protein LOC116213879 isoform X1 [Punica granatum]|nr:uncharacterized protein LOC116213879 isoform X1 [Punica granatum]
MYMPRLKPKLNSVIFSSVDFAGEELSRLSLTFIYEARTARTTRARRAARMGSSTARAAQSLWWLLRLYWFLLELSVLLLAVSRLLWWALRPTWAAWSTRPTRPSTSLKDISLSQMNSCK